MIISSEINTVVKEILQYYCFGVTYEYIWDVTVIIILNYQSALLIYLFFSRNLKTLSQSYYSMLITHSISKIIETLLSYRRIL